MAGPDGNSLADGAGVNQLVGGLGDDILLAVHGSSFVDRAGNDQITVDGQENPALGERRPLDGPRDGMG